MKPAQLAQLVVVAIAAFGVYSFARTARDGEARRVCTSLCALGPTYAGRNRMAPDFELPSLSGEKVRFSSYRGKVVILNFWTKTCRPCLEEMPSLAELGQVVKTHDNIVLVTISTDDGVDDVRGTLQSVLGTDKPPFEVLIDEDAKIVGDKFGTKLYPETWFIDPKGVIRARVDGARTWDGSIPVGFAESLKDPYACSIAFQRGRAVGENAGLCSEVASVE
ncbi:MAG: TlpA family protein disulfide reductase [Polyangiaceae bacterium]|nr:TlpA family protein disulfide reductase [Polyangiaceae bacterium]MBK8999351.1 TlpA family protein disulfide reductase [Myxococcales bacterium]MCE7893004.1 TlpA family protein disulfide reductase [Sorangiineae bacterium PRO1]